MGKIQMWLEKYKDVIPYAVFGVLTTIVNIVSFWFVAHILRISTMPSTIVAWVVAVLFAYVTNRKWVFHSEANTKEKVIKEMFAFFACRLLTGFVDWACMFVFVELLRFNDVLIKAGANVLVIVLNYIASKLVIFKKEVK